MTTEPVAPTAAYPPLTEVEQAYHLEELKGLKAEILAYTRFQVESFIYALVANGGIMAWLLTHKSELMAYGPWATKAAMLIPLFVTGLAYYWTSFYHLVIAAAGRYTKRLEERIAAPGLGWETFLTSKEERTLGARIGHRIRFGWLILALGNVLLPILV